MRRAVLASLTLLAFALRTHALAGVSLRWDEGWSIALATISWREMVRLTALDVHPPLYYVLLGPWLRLVGSQEFVARFFSVGPSTAMVPLIASTAVVWYRSHGHVARQTGLLAAVMAVVAPPLVYYAGVARMYSLAAFLSLLAGYAVGRLVTGPPRRPGWLLAAVAACLASLATFYYAAFAMLGLLLGAGLRFPGAWRRLLAAATLTALAYSPWLAMTTISMAERVTRRAPETSEVSTLFRGLPEALCGTILCQATGRWALAIVVCVLAAGLLAECRWRIMAMALLPAGLVLLGASAGAPLHMLAARYVIVATPFLLLALASATSALGARWRLAGLIAVVLLLCALLPPLGGYVYARSAEVSDAYDPSAIWRQLATTAGPNDVVVFNILSLAGAYERYRRPSDPSWSYAQLWDPVHEPLADAKARLIASLPAAGRLWLVLYRGVAGADTGAFKAWVDQTLYPTAGWWHEDVWIQGYVAAEPDREVLLNADFGHGVLLESARVTSRVAAGRGVGVELRWRAVGQPDRDGRVFVHAYDHAGRLVAQHDAFPAADTRPPTTWQRGEVVPDRHGLWIPPSARGWLQLTVGLYEPVTGARWLLADGGDRRSLGWLRVSGERTSTSTSRSSSLRPWTRAVTTPRFSSANPRPT